MAQHPVATAFWNTLSPSRQSWHVLQVTGAKIAETRARPSWRVGIAVKLCRPADPEAKGLVERANGYLETSFLPGRSFASPVDFNAQLQAWLVWANARVHRSIDAKQVDRWEPERLAMPPVPPQVGWHAWVRLPRDRYVRLDANDYSAMDRRVEVHVDPSDHGPVPNRLPPSPAASTRPTAH